MLKITTNCL